MYNSERDNWIDLSDMLKDQIVMASAPGRVDCGGSTDHVLAALLCRRFRPATTNIALDLRTSVQLKSYIPGRILIDIEGGGKSEKAYSDIRYSDQFGLIHAILTYFGICGVSVFINSQLPLRSGLGGSGVMCVALIGAILKALNSAHFDQKQLSEIALLAHHIENALFANTGLQDQLAAVFGKAHLWEWNYNSHLDYASSELAIESSVFERHSLLAYTGEPHPSTQNGSPVINRIKDDKNLDVLRLLTKLSELASSLADSLRMSNYEKAGQALQEELDIRSSFIANSINDKSRLLLKIAFETGCGAKIVGRGGGGCIWGLGSESSIQNLKRLWQDILDSDGKGYLLLSRIASSGLNVRVIDDPE